MHLTDTGDLIVNATEAQAIATQVLTTQGVAPKFADKLGANMAASELNGVSSHGLLMLDHYVNCLNSGTINRNPHPSWHVKKPGLMVVDADNSFSQPAIAGARPEFIDMVRRQGSATMAVGNSHHIGSLGIDIEPLAEAGLIAMIMSSSTTSSVPWGGTKSVFGTNPMAFACPRRGDAPIVWDQATTMKAMFDIRKVGQAGKQLDSPYGLNKDGQHSTDPQEVVDERRLFTFGEHKGTAIAVMIEALAPGLNAGAFSVQHASLGKPPTNKSGQTIIAIDADGVQPGFVDRIAVMVDAFIDNGDARIPGDGRLKRRKQALAEGIKLDAVQVEHLKTLGWSGPRESA